MPRRLMLVPIHDFTFNVPVLLVRGNMAGFSKRTIYELVTTIADVLPGNTKTYDDIDVYTKDILSHVFQQRYDEDYRPKITPFKPCAQLEEEITLAAVNLKHICGKDCTQIAYLKHGKELLIIEVTHALR